MLVSYYESGDIEDLANWIAKNCLQGTTKVNNLENMNYF